MCHTSDEIEAYLQQSRPSFSYGLELCEAVYGATTELSKYKHSSFVPEQAREKLREKLSEAVRLLSSSTDATKADPTEPPPVRPRKIDQVKAELRKLYKRSSFVHASMVQEASGAADQAKLYEYAREMMMDIQPQIDYYLDIIRTYEHSGQILGQKSLEADRAVELTKQINSIRSSISYHRRQRRVTSDELKQMHYSKKINELQTKLEASQAQLKEI